MKIINNMLVYSRQERINLILAAATKYSFECRKTHEYIHVALIFIPTIAPALFLHSHPWLSLKIGFLHFNAIFSQSISLKI